MSLIDIYIFFTGLENRPRVVAVDQMGRRVNVQMVEGRLRRVDEKKNDTLT